MNNDKNKLKFIEKSKKIWGNFFNYDKVEYINSKTNIILIHDGIEYLQRPDHNLEHRLPLLLSEKHSYKTDEWKRKVLDKFPYFKYDLSKAEYKNSHSPNIILLCNNIDKDGNKHGEFKLSSTAILSGNGCPKCKFEKLHDLFIGTKQLFIKKYKSKYNNDYDFDNFIYKGYNINGNIYCNKCNSFFQKSPSNLMKGEGCQKCSMPKLEYQIYQYCIKNNINFQCQYMISEFKRKYDFYISDYNILIECQGEQHFQPVNFGGITNEQAKLNFNLQQIIDMEKYNMAIKNNYKIYYYTNIKLYQYTMNNKINNSFYDDKYFFYDLNNMFKTIHN